jgi:hypothetical protein
MPTEAARDAADGSFQFYWSNDFRRRSELLVGILLIEDS